MTRQRALVRLAEQLLDLPAHRGAGGTRDEVGVQVARERLPQHAAHVDVVHHRSVPPAIGFRNDDLHLGARERRQILRRAERRRPTPARSQIRAVPLRTDNLPFHRPT